MKHSITNGFVSAHAETQKENMMLLALGLARTVRFPDSPKKVQKRRRYHKRKPCAQCGKKMKSLKMHATLTGHDVSPGF